MLTAVLISIVLNVHPRVQLETWMDSKKTFLPFGHGMDLAAFNSTGIQNSLNKSFQDPAQDKEGLNPFGTHTRYKNMLSEKVSGI